jgi:hypothetical protein
MTIHISNTGTHPVALFNIEIALAEFTCLPDAPPLLLCSASVVITTFKLHNFENLRSDEWIFGWDVIAVSNRS